MILDHPIDVFNLHWAVGKNPVDNYDTAIAAGKPQYQARQLTSLYLTECLEMTTELPWKEWFDSERTTLSELVRYGVLNSAQDIQENPWWGGIAYWGDELFADSMVAG